MPLFPQYSRAGSRLNSSIWGFNFAYRSPQPMTVTGSLTSLHSSAQWTARRNASKFSSKMMVIEFTATWCKPCRLMEPMLKELASKYTDIEFIKIDVDELMDVAQEFGVQTMPTILLMKKGEVIDKVVGAKKEELELKIDEHRARSYA